MMETLNYLQLKNLMVPVVWVVLALVVPNMVAVAVDVTVALGEPDLPAPVLAMMVSVPSPAASAGRKCLEKHLELCMDYHLVHMMG